MAGASPKRVAPIIRSCLQSLLLEPKLVKIDNPLGNLFRAEKILRVESIAGQYVAHRLASGREMVYSILDIIGN